ncbi:purine-nucleoside phosphorylase [Synchytrium endobioticum]|uniref:purine-nucleoside phosphorylase n=1 Tax=Synchytrium endobioticum TaxID=286115 RepID=A0A507CTC6_9FUNG|nr:purine-nucleoside phosphorylase [Synchytrium endobioticum]
MATPNGIPDLQHDYYDIKTYQDTANSLKSNLPTSLSTPKVAIICGSGLGGLADALAEPKVAFDYNNILNFPLSTVEGHAGKLVFGMLSGVPAVCMVGRFHMYEGHPLIRTVFPVRVFSLLGAQILIVTNAAGGLNPSFSICDIMVIEDHISLVGLGGGNALIGPNIAPFGPRFPATSDSYDYNLRVLAIQSAKAINLDMSAIREGVYCFVAGPSFETRAEARYLRSIGADAVGMSTVPEVIVARHCGMKVLGISLITNNVLQRSGKSAKDALADGSIVYGTAGSEEEGVANHEEVLASGDKRAGDLQRLVCIQPEAPDSSPHHAIPDHLFVLPYHHSLYWARERQDCACMQTAAADMLVESIQPLPMVTHDSRTHGHHDDDSDITRCPCGRTEETDDLMIMCEQCNVWQHGPCVGITNPKKVPKNYYCEQCKPENHPNLHKHLGKSKQLQPLSQAPSRQPTPPSVNSTPAAPQPTRSGRIRRPAVAIEPEAPAPRSRAERGRKDKAVAPKEVAVNATKTTVIQTASAPETKTETHNSSHKEGKSNSTSTSTSRAPSPKRRNTMNSREAAQWNTADILPLLTPGASITEEAFNASIMSHSTATSSAPTGSKKNGRRKRASTSKPTDESSSKRDDDASGGRSSSDKSSSPIETPVMLKSHLDETSQEPSPAVTPKSERAAAVSRGGNRSGGRRRKGSQTTAAARRRQAAEKAALDAMNEEEETMQQAPALGKVAEGPDTASGSFAGSFPTTLNISHENEANDVDVEMADEDDVAQAAASCQRKRDRELAEDEDYISEVKPSKRPRRGDAVKKSRSTTRRNSPVEENAALTASIGSSNSSNNRRKGTAHAVSDSLKSNRNASPHSQPASASRSSNNGNLQRQNTPHRDSTPPAKARPVHYRASMREMNNRVTHIQGYLRRVSAQFIVRPTVIASNSKSPISPAVEPGNCVGNSSHSIVKAESSGTPEAMVIQDVPSLIPNGLGNSIARAVELEEVNRVPDCSYSSNNKLASPPAPQRVGSTINGTSTTVSTLLAPHIIQGEDSAIEMMEKLSKQLEAFSRKYGPLVAGTSYSCAAVTS